jgi:hypothetical protein
MPDTHSKWSVYIQYAFYGTTDLTPRKGIPTYLYQKIRLEDSIMSDSSVHQNNSLKEYAAPRIFSRRPD